MKRKLYLLTAILCLMMLLGITTQAQTQRPQRACDVVKMEQTKGKFPAAPVQQVNKNKGAEASQPGSFQQFPIKAESEEVEKATVIMVYDIEDYDRYETSVIMFYNTEWSGKWVPFRYQENGEPVHAIIGEVPLGTYDIYTNTFDHIIKHYIIHIQEQVEISGDMTIHLKNCDAKNLVDWELMNENGELLEPSTIRLLDHDPWVEVVKEGNVVTEGGMSLLSLKGYGLVFASNGASVERIEGQDFRNSPGIYFINDLSDRYEHSHVSAISGTNGMLYLNRVVCGGAGPFPLKNNATDYLTCEETIQRTPMGRATLEHPQAVLWYDIFSDNYKEYINGNNISNIPVTEEGKVVEMVNAPRLGGEQLEGTNVSFRLGIVDNGDQYSDQEFICGPEMLLRNDGTREYLVTDVATTSEINVYRDDYPAHPKFSFNDSQRKGAIGNCCPLNAITSLNSYLAYYNAHKVNFGSEYLGRFGERHANQLDFIGNNRFSTMTAKYNGEVIYSGEYALNSLQYEWLTQPDGIYELAFINENVEVDGNSGENMTTVYFDQTKEDQHPPVLKMLQFRDGENNVTDRFEIPEEGTIMFAGGDFDARTITWIDSDGDERPWDYEECQPMTVEVSYAPYGTEEWQTLEGIEHQAEFDDISFGWFYTGSLTSVNTPSENGWFDLKFRLVDESGNWQEQTLSPAFRIDALVQSAVTEVRDNDAHEVARYSIDGKRVDTSHRGVTIVRMSDGTARKVIL